MSLAISVQILPHGEGLPLPQRASEGAAGLDLLAALPDNEPLTLQPQAIAAIATGLAMEIPHGFEGQVRPRSGLALKNGVTVLNSPGTVDADYRGEVKVILINHSATPFTITRGMRIAQMVIARVTLAHFVESIDLSTTKRGLEGFGSTGH